MPKKRPQEEDGPPNPAKKPTPQPAPAQLDLQDASLSTTKDASTTATHPIHLSLLPDSYVKARFSPSAKMSLSKLAANQLAKFVVVNPTTPLFLAVCPTEVSVVICEEDGRSFEGEDGVMFDDGYRVFQMDCAKSTLSRKYAAFMMGGSLLKSEIRGMFESTFDTEYVIVTADKIEKAKAAFRADKMFVEELVGKEKKEDDEPGECPQM